MNLTLCITLIIGLLYSTNSQLAFAADTQNEIEKLLTFHIENEFNVGAVVGTITPEGEQRIWTKGYGNLRGSHVLNEHTLFEIGSISKVFTGLILANLVVQGKVSLHDPLEKFLPELKGLPTGHLTLLELSTHTSGLPRLPTNLSPTNILNPYADYTEEKLLAFLKEYPLGDHPTPFSWDNYSNLGVGLLGHVLTRIENKSYAELLQTHITGPLNMPDTVVDLDLDQQARFATPYNTALEKVLPWNLNVLVGAGGLRSTLSDMLKFVWANLHPEKTPLSQALLLAQKIHQQNGNEQIGLGWGIETTPILIHGHSGGTGGFRSSIGLDTKNKKALVTLTNTASVLKCFNKVVLLSETCIPSFGVPVPDELLNSYIGTYKSVDGLVIVITRRKDYLIYEIVGQEKNRLEALTPTTFDIFGLATIEFVVQESGLVTHFMLKQGAHSEVFKKI